MCMVNLSKRYCHTMRLSTATPRPPNMDACAHKHMCGLSQPVPLKTRPLIHPHKHSISIHSGSSYIAGPDSPPLAYLLRSLILHKLALCADNKPNLPGMTSITYTLQMRYINAKDHKREAAHLWPRRRQSTNVILRPQLLKPSGNIKLNHILRMRATSPVSSLYLPLFYFNYMQGKLQGEGSYGQTWKPRESFEVVQAV